MKQPGSNFVSLMGLGLLALLILIAAYFDMPRAEAFLLLVLLLCLAAYLWAKFALRRIELELSGDDICAFPEQALELEAAVHNRKLLPLIWLDLCFPTAACSCLAPHPEDTNPEDEPAEETKQKPDLKAAFLWVMPHQSIRWTQRALAVHRGVCRVESVDLVSGDGFGLAAKTKKYPLPAPFRFVVYPRIVPAEVSLILNNMSEMESAKNGFYTDRTLLETTRDYREGDSFKNINWRLLARRDDVQVNVHEKLTMRRVCFVPDMYSFTYIAELEEGTQRVKRRVTDHEALERMFSVLASLIVRLHERGVLCSLVVPSFGECAERIIIPEDARMQVMQLLTALAEIDYDSSNTVLPTESMLLQRHRLGQFYVLSRSWENSVLKAEAMAAEELSAFSILQEASEQERADRRIFTESDFVEI